MITETFTYKAFDDEDIFVYKWSPDSFMIKGIVQIAHGLCEHAGRYHNFAYDLTSSGYVVYAHDQRGHGRTAKNTGNLVYIADGGWNCMIEDFNLLTDIIRSNYPNLPIFLFGHSMGSFLLRNILQQGLSKGDGVILSGTGHYDRITLNAGILIAKAIVRRKGAQKRSYYINRITFMAFNSYVSNPKTFFDWLSRDENIIFGVFNDPLYRIHCANNLFLELFKGMRNIQDTTKISRISGDIPMLFVSGDKDPVGHWGKDIPELARNYKHLGVRDVEYKLYPGARHEVINEINRSEVIQDIIGWLNSKA